MQPSHNAMLSNASNYLEMFLTEQIKYFWYFVVTMLGKVEKTLFLKPDNLFLGRATLLQYE